MFKKQSSLGRLRAALRQMRYPAEFRIADAALPENFAELLREALKRRTPRTVIKGLGEEQIIAIGTRLWRLRNELEKGSEGYTGETINRARSHIETLWELFAEGGVDIRDHTGQIWPKGKILLKALEFQRTSYVTRERVIQTVRPTIRFNGKIIQVGEVIVGTPEPPE
jgi:hypothetical protein